MADNNSHKPVICKFELTIFVYFFKQEHCLSDILQIDDLPWY